MHCVRFAASFAFCKAGRRMAANTAMMETTTNSSINVNACLRWRSILLPIRPHTKRGKPGELPQKCTVLTCHSSRRISLYRNNLPAIVRRFVEIIMSLVSSLHVMELLMENRDLFALSVKVERCWGESFSKRLDGSYSPHGQVPLHLKSVGESQRTEPS